MKEKEPEVFYAVIVRSRQVIERTDGWIDDVSKSTRIELISTSMIYDLQYDVQRETITCFFLLRESASLIRDPDVKINNLCNMKA